MTLQIRLLITPFAVFVHLFKGSRFKWIFKSRNVRGAAKLTTDKFTECEQLLWQGNTIASVANQAEIDDSTLRKAISSGRVKRNPSEAFSDLTYKEVLPSTKSERTRRDASAGCGMVTTCTRQYTLSSGGSKVKVLEVRRLTENGHQTAIITTLIAAFDIKLTSHFA